MSQNNSTQQMTHLAYRRKRFVQAISFTTTTSSTTLNAVTADGAPTTIPVGALWVLKPDQDLQYDLGAAARTLTTSNSATAFANAYEPCEVIELEGSNAAGTQPVLSHKGVAASGTVLVFAVF